MRLVQAGEFLLNEFDLIAIPDYESINQNGRFLIFDGLNALSPYSSWASFSIVLASNSLNKDKSGLLSLIDEVKTKCFELSCASAGEDFKLDSIKTAFIGGTLYCAKCEIRLKVKP